VLVWLWRLAATQRQTRISSLVPFLQLLRRPPRRRTHLVVNLLFWLQLAALTLLALALAQPAIFQRRSHTILVVVDTSASMAARSRGQTAFERARWRLRSRVTRALSGDHYFLMASAPVAAMMPQPSADVAQIAQALDALQVSDLSGSLSTTADIGRGLLGGRVDGTIVVTDEPAPRTPIAGVEFLTVDKPLSNVAIVGLDAQGALCGEAEARVVVAVQNFSKAPARVELVAAQKMRQVARAEATLAAGERASLLLPLASGAHGRLEVSLTAAHDALEVDNHAIVNVEIASAIPVAVVSDDPDFRRVIGSWLSACQGLVWSEGAPPADAPPSLLVTDREIRASASVMGAVEFFRSAPTSTVDLAHWMVAEDHPVSSFLPPVEPVAMSAAIPASAGWSGEPVVWGIVKGQRVPIVSAGTQQGRRIVSIGVDPVASSASTSLLVVFFNSLRWLMAQADVVRTGDPLLIPGWDPGQVAIHRPDGAVDHLAHDGGVFRYDATNRAGAYRLVHGSHEVAAAVNFLDPLESNLMDRASSWQPSGQRPAAQASAARARVPLTHSLLVLVLVILIIEWHAYRGKSAR
jgi:hypothetical protein